MTEDVDAAARALATAVLEHADVLRATPNDARAVLVAVAALRTAAVSYQDAVFEKTGWGPALDGLGLSDEDDDADDEDADDGEDDGEDDDEPGPLVTVAAEFRMIVTDEDRLRRYTLERLRAAGVYEPDHVADHVRDATQAVGELFLLDGWAADQYAEAGLDAVESTWETYAGWDDNGLDDPEVELEGNARGQIVLPD